MNALDMTALKILTCGVVAAALTLVGSYGFVASTAVVRMGVASQMVASAGTHLAQGASTDLLQ
jgi:hypothetical protein